MRIRRTRRTKVAYARLFDDPYSLFPGVKVTLFPNGEPEIWLDMGGNRGFRITAADGPAAAAVTVESLHGVVPTDVAGAGADYRPQPCNDGLVRPRVEVLQYKPDDWSQTFRAWVRGEAANPGDKPGESA
jgi:hypothetical protein